MAEENEFEAGPDWEGKTSFMPGVPDDEDAIPEVLYQVLLGNVYVLTRWKDGSTARGQILLQDLEDRLGFTIVKEGWYDVLGTYKGAELEGSL
jgi:hypothetical protein